MTKLRSTLVGVIPLCVSACFDAPDPPPDAAFDATIDAPDVAADVAPDVTVDTPPEDAGSRTFMMGDATQTIGCVTLSVEPATLRLATGTGGILRAHGGSGRGAVFAMAPGAVTRGASITVGGGVLAGPEAASFDVVATDVVCGLRAQAHVDVVGPFVAEPSALFVPTGRTVRLSARGALGAVQWDVLMAPARGDARLDAMTGSFTSGTVAGEYRLRARDLGGSSEASVLVTVGAAVPLAPVHSTLLVPAGRTVRLAWRGGSGVVDAAVSVGGPRVTTVAGVQTFDAAMARPGTVTVTGTDRFTGERATVRVVVGEELAPPPVARGSGNLQGDVAVGDVNHDGRADLVVGHANRSQTNSESGGVLVFLARPDGSLGATPDQVIEGARDIDHFGALLQVTDLDGDGTQDVIVQSPEQDLGRDGRGAVSYFLGSPTGLVTPAERVIAGEASNDRFGYSVLVADRDGDGAKETLVAAPNATNSFMSATCNRAGRVYMYDGRAGARGLYDAVPSQVLEMRDRLDDVDGAAQCRAGSEAGRSMALFDFDRDGQRDLVVGAPGNTSGNFGSVLVYRGQRGGHFDDNPAWVIHLEAALRLGGSRFGTWLDVVTVGTAELLVVRAPLLQTATNTTGGFFVFAPGSLGAPGAAGQVRVVNTSLAAARFIGTTNDGAGAAAVVTDVDGDGALDYVVGGVSDRNTDGVLYAFPLSALGGRGVLTPTATVRGVMGSTSAFGMHLATMPGVTPMRGMVPSLAALAPNATTDVIAGGAVRWMPTGAARSLAERVMSSVTMPLVLSPTSDQTGVALAIAPLRGGGDLVVGSSGAHSPAVPMMGTTAARPAGSRARVGAVDVFRGGEATSSQRMWVDRNNAAMGANLAVLDFDGDGRLDVAVGDPGANSGGVDQITSRLIANAPDDPCLLRTNDTVVSPTSPGGRGVVRVYLQDAMGALNERFWAIPRETVAMGATARRTGFGGSVAPAGDVNHDGVDDLVVGHAGGLGAEVVLGRRPDTMGRVLAVCADPAAAPYWPTRTDAALVGRVVTGVGDLDGDGCDETAASIDGGGRAGIWLRYGFGTRCGGHTAPFDLVISPDDRPLRNNVAGDETTRADDWGDLAGAATSMGQVMARGDGDLTGDRVPDVVFRDAALAWRDRNGPAVEIVSGAYLNRLCPARVCPTGLTNNLYVDGDYRVVGLRPVDAPDRVIVPTVSNTAVRFGASIVIADLDGDATSDLLVGAADDNGDGSFAGAVYAWRASSDPERFAGSPWLRGVGDVGEASLFGAAVSGYAAATASGGGAWIAVGAPASRHRGPNTGAAYRWRIER